MSDTFNEDMEPLFLAYGKACYVAQNLESTLRFLLVVNRSHRDGQAISQAAITEIETETAREAVFALFDRAKRSEYFTSQEERLVKAAMRARNHLMHEYWDKNIKKVIAPDGRLAVMNELSAINEQIRVADKIIVSLIDRYMIECGLTTEICKQLADQVYESGVLHNDAVWH